MRHPLDPTPNPIPIPSPIPALYLYTLTLPHKGSTINIFTASLSLNARLGLLPFFHFARHSIFGPRRKRKKLLRAGRGENNQEGQGFQPSNTLEFRKSLPTFWRTEIVILKNVWPRCQKVCYEKWRE